tara:strand:+ start:871 stop:1053 length:183 start_codon:yes stop_codon:yes gene_type:complete
VSGVGGAGFDDEASLVEISDDDRLSAHDKETLFKGQGGKVELGMRAKFESIFRIIKVAHY